MRKTLCVLCILSLTLSGCTAAEDYAKEQMLNKSGITSNADYQKYKDLLANEKLDENGEYIDSGEDAIPAMVTVREKPICVTFAYNHKLDIKYFSDGSCTQQITKKISDSGKDYEYRECYVSPGDSIYAQIGASNDEFYQFSKFKFIEDHDNGEITDISFSADRDMVIIKIPENFSGTDIIVEPVGCYHYRIITLNDMISGGAKAYGNWSVNDIKYESGDVKLFPRTNYTVKYEFDVDKYYTSADKCSPEPYLVKDGYVEFKTDNGANTDYSVGLYYYTELSISDDNKKIQYIKVNGNVSETAENNHTKTLNDLKENDEILIAMNDAEYKINGIDRYEKNGNAYVFTYTVPEAKSSGEASKLFKAVKWNKKDVGINISDINKDSFIDRLKDIFKSEPKEEAIFTLSVEGVKDKTYTYKDIKGKKSIEISEPDTITVKINQGFLRAGDITLTDSNSNSYVVTADSPQCEFSFEYADIDNLSININGTR